MDPVIRKTEERLEWLSGDEETIRLYEAREHSLIELNSLLSEGKAAGKAEGKAEAKREVALKLIQSEQDNAFVAEITGLSVDVIEGLRKK